jgi:hypothetical protein
VFVNERTVGIAIFLMIAIAIVVPDKCGLRRFVVWGNIMNAVETLIVATTERQLMRLRQHVIELQAAIERSRARIQQSWNMLARLQSVLLGANQTATPKAPKLGPGSWPCGIRISDRGRPAAEALSARERRELADRLVASLRAIGLDCEVIDTFPTRSEAPGQPG